MADEPLCQIITPVGNMGYGFDEEITYFELTQLVPTGIPTAIILDSGSTDSGPQKLALGSMTCPRSAYKRDLSKLLRLVHTFRVPLIFSSAGGDGADEHVQEMEKIIEELCAEEQNKDYHITTISMFAGINKTTVLTRLGDGRITPCGPCVPTLTAKDVELSPRVVAQAGPEPFVDAMEAYPDFNVIIGGRAYDPAPYVGYSIYQLKRQYRNISEQDIRSRIGGFTHMGKIMECGGLCSRPKSGGAVAVVYSSGIFEVRPTAPDSRCTPQSVAAHALYENTRPDILRGPGGSLHLEQAKYEQLADGRTVRVSGSRYSSSRSQGVPYQFKLEAGRICGYRSIFMGGIKDPILIAQIDVVLGRVKAYVKQQNSDVPDGWKLDFHVYGRDHFTAAGNGEIFVIAEALASTQAHATSLCNTARVGMIHGPYPGQKATSGNLGFGIGGIMEIETGECTEFSVYHLMDLEDGEEHLEFDDQGPGLLRGKVQIFGRGKRARSDVDFRSSIATLQRTLTKPKVLDFHKTAAAAVATAKKSMATAQISSRTLADVCQVMRSKNAGPYEITLDAIFYNQEAYNAVKRSGVLACSNVAKALGVTEADIVWMGWYEPALAFKVTIPRVRWGKKTSAGGFMESDIHGSQEHTGLATLALYPTNGVAGILSGYGCQGALVEWEVWEKVTRCKDRICTG
ncbi:hypothetical protein BGZ63DRAFT_414507 [Mariannaea sp. PMI_226]|nr:hypothetical protein BGZ63DRAFT_414507 [Mariannaea sp. PMI_226]